jgi:hypothetical protein
VGLVEGKSSRFAEHDLSTGLMGVSGDMASDLVSLGRVAIGDPDTRDVQNVRSLMPYNNLWWLRGLFDRAESSAAAALGAD